MSHRTDEQNLGVRELIAPSTIAAWPAVLNIVGSSTEQLAQFRNLDVLHRLPASKETNHFSIHNKIST